MLRITEHRRGTESDVLTLLLEGRLVRPWVHEFEMCWRELATKTYRRIVVDLAGVTFIDAEGKALLASLWQQGAELRASGCLTTCVVEEITGVGRIDSASRKSGGTTRS